MAEEKVIRKEEGDTSMEGNYLDLLKNAPKKKE